jgi:hypothetical protein
MREFLRKLLFVLRHIFLLRIGLISSLDAAAAAAARAGGLVEIPNLADFV